MSSHLTDHAARNRASWAREAPSYVPGAERNWVTDEITWGILDVPEAELEILPDVAGKDVVELGCGTAYVSAWLARRGARVVGVDVTEEQLATARAMQKKHRLEFPLVHASAEDVPLPDASFDLVVSEYGASIWCDPDCGSRRPRGCFARAASSSSSSTARSRCSASRTRTRSSPRAPRCSGRTSG
jgi:SAM-dependent methyltransferase